MCEFVIEIHTLNVYDSKDTVQYYNDIEIHKRQLISVVTLTVESMCPLHALWKNWDNVKTYTIKFFMLKWIGVNSKWMFDIDEMHWLFSSKFY